jgi:glycopeptide antibiotics resistance protein
VGKERAGRKWAGRESGRRRADERGVGREPRLQRSSAVTRLTVLLVAFVAAVAFAVVLARLTLEPSAASAHLTHTNLRPGASIRAYLDQPEFRDTVKQIGGNILLGVPFGVLLPALWPRARGLIRVTLVTAAVMLLVELAQGALVEGRAFDIDDVILNTTGAILGYLPVGQRLGRALHPRRIHWWHRLGLVSYPGTRGNRGVRAR